MKSSIQKLLQFFIYNFGPLIGFYFINHFFGFKVGIFVSLIVVAVEFLWLKYRKVKPTTFFYFTSAVVTIFGILDLTLKSPFFFKFESSITNLLFAYFFAVTLFKDKSLVQEIAETQGRTDKEQTPDKHFFFRFYTLIWTLYFVAKAGIYLWINFNATFEDALFIRILIGKGTFWAMMAFSIFLPTYVWKAMETLKALPSQRQR